MDDFSYFSASTPRSNYATNSSNTGYSFAQTPTPAPSYSSYMPTSFAASAGSGIVNTGNDAFSNFTDSGWQRPAYAQYPATTSNPAYRNQNFLPWYTQINPFTAGQIIATLGMRR